MKTVIAIWKPKLLVVDNEDCKTVGTLVRAVKNIDPEVLDGHLEYLVDGPDGMGKLSLNKPGRKKNNVLSEPECGLLEIRALLEVTIHIYDSSLMPVFMVSVTISPRDTVSHLKAEIEANKGIESDFQRLEFNGVVLEDHWHLSEAGIYHTCSVTLSESINITYYLGEEERECTCQQDKPLLDLLKMIGEIEHEEVDLLTFAFVEISGTVAAEVKDWHHQKHELFQVGQIDGTVKENGLLHNDEIRVYRKPRSMKRKRSDDVIL